MCGHVGGVGVMTMLGAAVAGSSIARATVAGGVGSAAAGTAMDSYQKLMDRIAVPEGVNAAGGVDSATISAERNNWTGRGDGVGQGKLRRARSALERPGAQVGRAGMA